MIRQLTKRAYLAFRETFLQILFGLLPNKKNKVPEHEPERILVISQQRLGDAVLSVPFFQTLHDKYPMSAICVLTNPYVREFYEMIPEISCFIEYPRSESGLRIKDLLVLLSKIRKQNYELIIDLNTDGRLEYALITKLSRADFSVGYGQNGRGFFYDYSIISPNGKIHFVKKTMKILSVFGIKRTKQISQIKVSHQACHEARTYLSQSGVQTGDVMIGLHPGGYHPTQRWPEESFAKLADTLLGSGLGKVILCGGPGDAARIRAIKACMKEEPLLMPEQMNLKQFAALLSMLDLLVCNNSGPLHLAAAVGTSTVSFMGPTDADQWWPVGEDHVVFRKNELSCIGCNLGYCKIKTHECMRRISWEEVFQSIRERLGMITLNKKKLYESHSTPGY